MDQFIAVIPAFNEAEHIAGVVENARKWVRVIVVDDGSTDETVKQSEEAGAIVVCHTTNQGKGSALRSGFKCAREVGCTAVITLDGDGQHDPEEIARFIQSFQARPADLIIGQRNFKEMPLSRRIANTTGGWLFSWAMGANIPDNQSGYRLLSRRFLDALVNSGEQGFEFEVEMLQICLKLGFDLRWIPIRTIYSGERSHIQPLHHLVNFLRIVWNTRQQMRETSAFSSPR